jgi:hypothetical protein
LFEGLGVELLTAATIAGADGRRQTQRETGVVVLQRLNDSHQDVDGVLALALLQHGQGGVAQALSFSGEPRLLRCFLGCFFDSSTPDRHRGENIFTIVYTARNASWR